MTLRDVLQAIWRLYTPFQQQCMLGALGALVVEYAGWWLDYPRLSIYGLLLVLVFCTLGHISIWREILRRLRD